MTFHGNRVETICQELSRKICAFHEWNGEFIVIDVIEGAWEYENVESC